MSEILTRLVEAAGKHAPYVNGVVSLPPQSTNLFFNRGQTSGCVDLLKPSEEQLELLATACEPASFGRNSENVLDETYRKAGKLDVTNFALNFDLTATGIADNICKELLTEKRPIRAELYKLNLYGPGSFFKAHKDTPRAKTMFGSLVLVLPTPHRGGELVLRADGRPALRWDSSAILASHEKPAIAYIAFYGDIEHEVLPVTSGNRITLTYNLFFEKKQGHDFEIHERSALVHPLAAVLLDTLRNPNFLPEGGLLGYGFQYEYPMGPDDDVDDVETNLKGEDANIARVCRALKLKASVVVVYRIESYYTEPRYISVQSVANYARDPSDTSHLYEEIMSGIDGAIELTWDGLQNGATSRPHCKEVLWVTEPCFDGIRFTYNAYGNEASYQYDYGSFCFLVTVKPYEERKQLLEKVL